MKMEMQIGDKVLVIEAEGAISVQVWDVAPSVQTAAVSVAPEVPVPPQILPQIAVEETVNNGLFARLAALRRELAVAGGVPPYVIFQDKTLREMSEKMPSSLEDFSQISGVGQAKLEKYGNQFLAIINGAAA